MVEGTVSPGEAAALRQGDDCARALDERGRRSEEGKGHGDEGRFAEHRGGTGGGEESRAFEGLRAGEPVGLTCRPAGCLNTLTR